MVTKMKSNSSYTKKLESWLDGFTGNLPVYDKLIKNFIKVMGEDAEVSSKYNRGSEHVIEFPTPAVFYDHSIEEYRPDYEYETFMFKRLIGLLQSKNLVLMDIDFRLLGNGNDVSNFRPYEVVKVTFDDRDYDEIKQEISNNKSLVSDSVIANLAKDLL